MADWNDLVEMLDFTLWEDEIRNIPDVGIEGLEAMLRKEQDDA